MGGGIKKCLYLWATVHQKYKVSLYFSKKIVCQYYQPELSDKICNSCENVNYPLKTAYWYKNVQNTSTCTFFNFLSFCPQKLETNSQQSKPDFSKRLFILGKIKKNLLIYQTGIKMSKMHQSALLRNTWRWNMNVAILFHDTVSPTATRTETALWIKFWQIYSKSLFYFLEMIFMAPFIQFLPNTEHSVRCN